MKPENARKALSGVPKDIEKTFQVAAHSTVVLNPDPVFGPVHFPSSHEYLLPKALPSNPYFSCTSVQPPLSTVFAPQGYVMVTSKESDSHPVGGGSPRGVS